MKLGTLVGNGWMYRVYRNQTAAAYSSFYFIFLSLQFSNIKNFRHTFLRNCEAYKVETCYTRGQWINACIIYTAKSKLGTHMNNGWIYHIYTAVLLLIHPILNH